MGWDLYDYRLENRSAGEKSRIGDPTSTKDVDQRQTAWYFHDVMTLDRWSFTLGARRLDVDTETETTGFGAGEGAGAANRRAVHPGRQLAKRYPDLHADRLAGALRQRNRL